MSKTYLFIYLKLISYRSTQLKEENSKTKQYTESQETMTDSRIRSTS